MSDTSARPSTGNPSPDVDNPIRSGTTTDAELTTRCYRDTMPPRPRTPGEDPSGVDHISNISSSEDLIRYAAAAQLARLTSQEGVPRTKVADAIGMDAGNLANALAGRGGHRLTSERLRLLDEALIALAPGLDHLGGLASFGARLRGLNDRNSLSVMIPPSWNRDILRTSTDDEPYVLIQASSLLSIFLATDKAAPDDMGRSRLRQLIRRGYEEEIKQVVHGLILIGGAPPTPRNLEAQILLGSLSKYAFEITGEQLVQSLRTSPLGFRVWRALTKLLLLSKGDRSLTGKLKSLLTELLSEVDSLREISIYPGRSLDLELAIAIPEEWPEANRLVTDILLSRARNSSATLRERGTAAMGLWQRAVQNNHTDDPDIQRNMKELIDHFTSAESDRPDIASGLRWVAATLDYAVTNRVVLCNTWPKVDEPWFARVKAAADTLDYADIPPAVLAGTKKLFLQAVLQNAGVTRRMAIDTLVVGGYTEPVARALKSILRNEDEETWIRIRALFAMGFLQHRSQQVADALVAACEFAYANVTTKESPPARAHITEAHTALFSIGDCYGAKGAENEARQVRDRLGTTVRAIVESPLTHDPTTYTVARATAYLLTFTAQARKHPAAPDLSEELLEKLSRHPDRVTRDFSEWVLRFRFADDGGVRPLLAAPR